MAESNPAKLRQRRKAAADPREKQARVQLAALYRIFAHLGFDDFIYTHMAARVPHQPDHMLMNPSGLLFEEMRASSFVKLPLAREPSADGPAYNAIGYRLHGAVLKAHAAAVCTIHLHTPAGVAVSAQQSGLLPLSQPAMLLAGAISYHENEGLIFDAAEQARLVRALGDNQVMFLRNHGTLVWGRSFAEAFELAYNLERACETQIAALAGESKAHLPPAGVPELTRRQYLSFGVARDAGATWQAVLRKVDRLDPRYKL